MEQYQTAFTAINWQTSAKVPQSRTVQSPNICSWGHTWDFNRTHHKIDAKMSTKRLHQNISHLLFITPLITTIDTLKTLIINYISTILLTTSVQAQSPPGEASWSFIPQHLNVVPPVPPRPSSGLCRTSSSVSLSLLHHPSAQTESTRGLRHKDY